MIMDGAGANQGYAIWYGLPLLLTTGGWWLVDGMGSLFTTIGSEHNIGLIK